MLAGPFFIFIILVVTLKGRTVRTSILSPFYMPSNCEQMSAERFTALQTPIFEDRKRLVHELIFKMALRWALVRILGIMILLMSNTTNKSMLTSLRRSSGFIVKQDPYEVVPALFTTIPISKSFHSSKVRYSFGKSFGSDKSHDAYLIQVYLQICLNSQTFWRQRYQFRLINSSLNPSSANISANPRPMPCVKPVMTTQQSPYFCLRAGPLRRASLRKWAGTQFHECHALCSHPPTFAVSAATPAIKSTLRRDSSPLLKSSDCAQSDALCKSGEASKAAFAKRTTGFQSHSTPFNMAILLIPNIRAENVMIMIDFEILSSFMNLYMEMGHIKLQ